MFRCEVWSGGAGSRRHHPGLQRCLRRSARLHPAFENLDDNHTAAAAWAGWTIILRLGWRGILWHRHDREQFARPCDICFANSAGKQSVMADAMEACWQDVQEEAPDELAGGERHDALPVRPIAAIILVAEGHICFV
jgi:hypothetical protein